MSGFIIKIDVAPTYRGHGDKNEENEESEEKGIRWSLPMIARLKIWDDLFSVTRLLFAHTERKPT
jgi:hypothetical protein